VPIQKYYSIEFARGVAAVSVVLLHAGTGMSPEQYFGKVGLNGFLDFGRFGVDLFFVISGFIICKSTGIFSGGSIGVCSYINRRAFRILPAYYFLLCVSLFVNQFQRGRVEIESSWVVKQLIFMDSPLFVSAAWTLQLELIFYFVIAATLFKRSIGVLAGVVWCSLIMHRAFWAEGGASYGNFYEVISNPYFIYFFIGVIGCYVDERTSVQTKKASIASASVYVAVVVALFASGKINESSPEIVSMSAIGVFIMLALSAAIYMERIGMLDFKQLSYFGRISYSLYLCNILILGMSSAIMVRIGIYHQLSEAAVVVVGLIFCICFADLVYRLIEVRFISIGRRLENRCCISQAAA
jgi:peptidoglycan/LPS O-acetylase OafA/YrhL